MGPYPLDLTENDFIFVGMCMKHQPAWVKFKIEDHRPATLVCLPMQNVRVNIWHCSDGLYSGYDNASNPRTGRTDLFTLVIRWLIWSGVDLLPYFGMGITDVFVILFIFFRCMWAHGLCLPFRETHLRSELKFHFMLQSRLVYKVSIRLPGAWWYFPVDGWVISWQR